MIGDQKYNACMLSIMAVAIWLALHASLWNPIQLSAHVPARRAMHERPSPRKRLWAPVACSTEKVGTMTGPVMSQSPRIDWQQAALPVQS